MSVKPTGWCAAFSNEPMADVRGSSPLLEIKDIRKSFRLRRSGLFSPRLKLDVVKGIDLNIHRGEIVGLVGASGCGKSTLAQMACGLLPPDSGIVLFKGADVYGRHGSRNSNAGLQVQMVFQNPQASLNPRMTVGEQIAEAPVYHRLVARHHARDFSIGCLERVGLAADTAARYPHQFSGGQRQRIVIARALAVNPEVLVCDEPVTALDVSVRSGILNLLLDLREADIAMLFISHDQTIVDHLCDRVFRMDKGQLSEGKP